jgi:hydrogenase/urease accessory protein HupE
MRQFFLACLVLLAGARAARAHPNLQNAMWVVFEPERIHLAVNVSAKEISVAQGVAPSEAGGEAATRHGEYLLGHLTVSIGGEPLTGKILNITPPPQLAEPETTFFQYEVEYPLGGRQPPEATLAHEMLKEWPYAAGAAWDVTYVVRAKRSDSNEVSSWLLTSQNPLALPTGWRTPADATVAPPKAETEGWRTFREYLWHGVMHILTGYDHLLFVSALVIATLSLWELVKVIAAFTLAHTITLTLSVFDIFRLPPWIVEPTIALSIVFVALENILWPQRAHSRTRLAVAFGFGLIHGLGFAGGLLDAMNGLPALSLWIALAAFSLGVEIGHQIVVLPLFAFLTLGRQKIGERFDRPVSRYGSLVISCCGAYYLVVALHEQVFTR